MRTPFFAAAVAAVFAVSLHTAQATEVATSDAAFEAEVQQAESILRSMEGGERTLVDELIHPHELRGLMDASRVHFKAGETEQAYAKLRKAQRQLKIRFD